MENFKNSELYNEMNGVLVRRSQTTSGFWFVAIRNAEGKLLGVYDEEDGDVMLSNGGVFPCKTVEEAIELAKGVL